MPATEGVPLIVSVLLDQLLETPVGKPETEAPVAPVVVYVIFDIAVLIHFDCASVPTKELNVIVLLGNTVATIAVLDADVHPPPVAST